MFRDNLDRVPIAKQIKYKQYHNPIGKGEQRKDPVWIDSSPSPGVLP